jgi:hypothetical protein
MRKKLRYFVNETLLDTFLITFLLKTDFTALIVVVLTTRAAKSSANPRGDVPTPVHVHAAFLTFSLRIKVFIAIVVEVSRGSDLKGIIFFAFGHAYNCYLRAQIALYRFRRGVDFVLLNELIAFLVVKWTAATTSDIFRGRIIGSGFRHCSVRPMFDKKAGQGMLE